MESTATEASASVIVCRVTPWYFRRMSMMAAMLVLMGAWFLYDWQYGYHAANKIADKKDWFEQVHLKGYDEAKAANKLDQWVKDTEAQGLPAGKNGEPPRWVSYAAENGWSEKPHRWTDREIAGQFWWGSATIFAGLVVAAMMLFNRNRVLTAYPDHWVSPQGTPIYYAQVFRVDKRKWEVKGLAYAWYRETPDSPEKKAVLDDFKFDHVGLVLDRLLSHFKGELIEKLPDAAAPAPKNPGQAS